MKMKFIIAVFLTSALLFMSFGFRFENKLDAFKWLNGSWLMKKKNGSAIMESWTVINDSSLAGESLNLSPTGESSVSESLQLVYRNKEFFYISAVKGQNNGEAVKFKITSHSENGFVAENPKHDFPKRITYKLINKDSIYAFIDGGPALPEKKFNFYYSSVKN
jgi:hypothetical protein